ncbi:hypothetical protein LSM04_004116 [Trypanosoma melophagium]|uniref:uncharacterized protein n=1 Tax=Trypanosoma melophagium TaxID=715481 RepID=UPI00351A7315|nr:hypothetical protein LSM04_004116 [Trypanosoma melophagium]
MTSCAVHRHHHNNSPLEANELPPQYPSPPHKREEEKEEYIEMDYASEIEECSGYIFSERPYCRNVTRNNNENDDDEDWIVFYFQQQRERKRQQKEEERYGEGEFKFTVPAYGHIALRALITEARSKHLAHLNKIGANTACVLEAKRHWRTIAHRTAEDLELFGYERVRRSIAAMCLFNYDNISLQYDNGSQSGVYARLLADKKLRVLRQLQERNVLFISTEPTSSSIPVPISISSTTRETPPEEEEEECTSPFYSSSSSSSAAAAGVLSPMYVFPIPCLNPNVLEISSVELPLLCGSHNAFALLLDTSLESGGASSSENSNKSNMSSSSNSSNSSEAGECDSPQLAIDDLQLATTCN